MSNFKGFDLFLDIEQNDLRNRNRAVVLANIASDHTKNGKISPVGAGLVIGYFNQIPLGEREDVKQRFSNEMNLRGFQLVTP